MENFLLHSFILPGWEILEMLRCYGCLLLRGTNQYNQYFFVIAFSVHQIYIYIYIYIYHLLCFHRCTKADATDLCVEYAP